MKKNLFLALSLMFLALGVMFINQSTVKAGNLTTTHAPTSESNTVVIGGGGNYPHSTGACFCGQYPQCHPKPGCPIVYDSNGIGHYLADCSN